MKTMIKIILYATGLISLIILHGCGDVAPSDTTSPVWLEILLNEYDSPDNSVTGSSTALIDVCDLVEDNTTGEVYCSYYDEFIMTTFYVNRVNPDPYGDSPYLDVHIFRYRVTYERNDGGYNVPGKFDIWCDLWCQFLAPTTYDIKILHADQKLDPPLIFLIASNHCVDYETGDPIIKGYCHVEFWAKDNAGNHVYAQTTIPVQFADWGD